MRRCVEQCSYRCSYCGSPPEQPCSGALMLVVCVLLTAFTALSWWGALYLLGLVR